jgi:hypothetical protein|tara:strand:- start:3441 stop:4295 length:855 start_codon:yes stop_codon:yes gene_type:complete
MPTDIETPELVELQDVFAKTESTVVNELPSESESIDTQLEGKEAESSGGLTADQKSNLPEALQKAILAKQSGNSDKKEGEEDSHEQPMNLDTMGESSEPTEEEKEDLFSNPTETEEPAGEFTPPVDAPINPTPVDNINRAEIYAAHSLAQKVASMPLAEYEDWLFPHQGSPDHLRGQMCLARIDASLKAANGGRAVAELWQVKIGAALWSRLNFRDNAVEETRCELEKAPPMELIPLIPRNASEAISVIDEIQTGNNQHSDTNWGVIGACGVAVLLPILLLRRG